jgi:hypothetical protein
MFVVAYSTIPRRGSPRRGEEEGAIERRAIEIGVRKLPIFGSSCMEARSIAACLELCGHFHVVTISFRCVSQDPAYIVARI